MIIGLMISWCKGCNDRHIGQERVHPLPISEPVPHVENEPIPRAVGIIDCSMTKLAVGKHADAVPIVIVQP